MPATELAGERGAGVEVLGHQAAPAETIVPGPHERALGCKWLTAANRRSARALNQPVPNCPWGMGWVNQDTPLRGRASPVHPAVRGQATRTGKHCQMRRQM